MGVSSLLSQLVGGSLDESDPPPLCPELEHEVIRYSCHPFDILKYLNENRDKKRAKDATPKKKTKKLKTKNQKKKTRN